MDITVGIDPGESTGIAILDGTRLIYVNQCKPEYALSYLDALLETYSRIDDCDVLIACERYISGGHHGRSHQPMAQQMIGAFTQIAKKWDRKFILQGPADARSIASNSTLKEMGMFVTAKQVNAPDAMDALMAVKHAIFALATHKASVFEHLMGE
jgi:hypothetical protein